MSIMRRADLLFAICDLSFARCGTGFQGLSDFWLPRTSVGERVAEGRDENSTSA
jgi:hypothetical protein